MHIFHVQLYVKVPHFLPWYLLFSVPTNTINLSRWVYFCYYMQMWMSHTRSCHMVLPCIVLPIHWITSFVLIVHIEFIYSFACYYSIVPLVLYIFLVTVVSLLMQVIYHSIWFRCYSSIDSDCAQLFWIMHILFLAARKYVWCIYVYMRTLVSLAASTLPLSNLKPLGVRDHCWFTCIWFLYNLMYYYWWHLFHQTRHWLASCFIW